MADLTPGYKTTEFWKLVVTSGVVVLNQSGVLGKPLPEEVIAGIMGVAFSYMLYRGWLKSNTMTPAANMAEVGKQAIDNLQPLLALAAAWVASKQATNANSSSPTPSQPS